MGGWFLLLSPITEVFLQRVSDVEGFVEELKCAGEPYHSSNVFKM